MKAKRLFFSLFFALVFLFLPASGFAGHGGGGGGHGGGGFHGGRFGFRGARFRGGWGWWGVVGAIPYWWYYPYFWGAIITEAVTGTIITGAVITEAVMVGAVMLGLATGAVMVGSATGAIMVGAVTGNSRIGRLPKNLYKKPAESLPGGFRAIGR